MKKIIHVVCFALGLIGLVACAQADNGSNSTQQKVIEKNCELDNLSLQAMPLVEATFSNSDGSVFKTTVRLADNNRTRAAGFQRVCASTIAAMPILFVFASEVQPSFHMRNVVAPIDIAFIDKRGRLESIQAMKPYSLISINKPLYSPDRPVVAAFEAHPGYFEKHSISFQSRFSWSKLKASSK